MIDPLVSALRSLPHGPEFRFIDRLTRLAPGQSGTGEYRIRGDEPFLKGHFPGEPLFPGVLLIEAGAQLAGAVAQSDPEVPPIHGLKLAGVRVAKFFGSAIPGQDLRLEARVTGRLGGMVQADVEGFVERSRVMAASITLAGSEPS